MSAGDKSFSTSVASRRASLAVPPLNEETLVSGLSNPFGTSGYVFIPGDDANNFLASASNLTSPSGNNDSPSAMNALQQQAAAQLEQEYLFTRNNLQQCSRSVLLSIITSLLDDCPAAMTGEVRLRMERAMNNRGNNAATGGGGALANSPSAGSARSQGGGRKASLQGNTSGIAGGGPTSTLGVNAVPWTPNSHSKQSAGGSVTSPFRANQGSPNSHRKAGGRNQKSKDEDQELCSVHNNMRAIKHLQRNPTTGLYECIHGFHCLVDGPAPGDVATTTVPTAVVSPTNTSAVSSMHPATSPPPASQSYSVTSFFDAPPLQTPPQQPEQFHLCYVRDHGSASSSRVAEPSADVPHTRAYFDPNGVNEDDLNQLEDLLQSVRDGMRDDA